MAADGFAFVQRVAHQLLELLDRDTRWEAHKLRSEVLKNLLGECIVPSRVGLLIPPARPIVLAVSAVSADLAEGSAETADTADTVIRRTAVVAASASHRVLNAGSPPV